MKRKSRKTNITYDEDHILNIVLMGNSGCGKTCLLDRMADDKFSENTFQTFPGDVPKEKEINLDGSQFLLRIWDTPGSERYRSLLKPFQEDIREFNFWQSGVILVYDVTNWQSSKDIDMWLEFLQEDAPEDLNNFGSLVIFGNKIDLDLDWFRFERFDFPYFQVSAKSGKNVDPSLMYLAREIQKIKTKTLKLVSFLFFYFFKKSYFHFSF